MAYSEELETDRRSLWSYPNFSCEEDVAALKGAIANHNIDEAAIVKILAKRSTKERQEIVELYEKKYGTTLVDALQGELSDDLERLVLDLLTPTAELLADHVHRALSGGDFDEQTLVELLCTRSIALLKSIREAYQKKYQRLLLNDLEGENSTYFRRLLVAICSGLRNEDVIDFELVPQWAEKLCSSVDDRMDTDESEFTRILTRYSYPMLRGVFIEWGTRKGTSLKDYIKLEFSGPLRKGLLTVIKSIENRYMFIAKALHDAIAGGLRTNASKVVRIIVTRAEVDLSSIDEEYRRVYGHPIANDIRGGDAAEEFKRGLILMF